MDKLYLEIKEKIIKTIKTKLSKYNPETVNMPFHYRLLGKDRMALYSFIQSLNTTFGISIFEPVAEILAKNRFQQVKKQYIVGNEITSDAQAEIQNLLNQLLSSNTEPNKSYEIERIRTVARNGNVIKTKIEKADLFLKAYDGAVYLIDLKTAKPNMGAFKELKRMLLEWVAIYLYKENANSIKTLIAIPYNPYEPKPYERWTLRGLFDLNEEIMVGEEFWNFLGGEGTYEKLLETFEMAGIELRPQLDEFFSSFRK